MLRNAFSTPQNGNMRRRIIFRILAALAGGLIPALLEWGLGYSDPKAVLHDTLIGMAYALAISALAWTILPPTVKRILKMSSAAKWLFLAAAVTLVAAAGGLIALFAVTAIHLVPPDRFWPIYFVSLRVSVVLTLVFTLGATFHGVLMSKLNKATADLKAKELVEERLRQAATEAKLSSLESRIHPHFLFNTLNSISALIRENPVEAERMVERLAALLRFSLDSSGDRLVSLASELSIVRAYLEIEKVRFGDRLSYRIEADPTLSSLPVPPLSVQTLVENSVKYAVSARREGAEIVIRAQLRNGRPAIDVLDNGPGFALADLKAGHGLDLLQSRLATQFGPSSALEIGRDPNLTRVTVVL
jgi:two-component system, LytTR family, sensor histidine kinase AlgZ